MVVFGQKSLYSGKSGCIRAKVVVLGQKWLYSNKKGCVRAKWLDLGKSSYNRAKVSVFGQSGCILAKLEYSVKVVVFKQKWFYSGKVVEIGQK